ncbi:acetoacetyl-CoA synthetase-like [Uloborus diversus]|uniref:acetoacetyl-CoA synthetase-like n=1 Tax=Uloborus diversus TaxID=327109 RepID=UPI002408F4C6|nr:acetoacetyl-CoA synthetase-like [Uloborus diversus]
MENEINKKALNLHPEIVYQPKEIKENQNWRFRKFVEKKYGLKLNDYWELYEWSRQNFREFWECVWIFFDIISSEPYTEVFDKNGSFENTDWFKGAKLNFSENLLRVRSSKTAIITADEHDNIEHVSYEQLYTEVATYAEALKSVGVKKGDVVSCYMSNRIEAVYAHLATASIGALWSGVLPLLGVKAVVSMLDQTNPKVLFATGNFHFDGEEIDMVQRIPNIMKRLPSLKKVVLIPSKGKRDEMKDLPECVSIEDFLRPVRENISKCGANIIFEQLPFNYPFSVFFTSGTTGSPKAIVHSHGSFLAPLRDLGLSWDCTNDDVLLSYTPVGWVTWNFLECSLYFGLTLVLYDGFPFEGTSTRFWDLVDKFGITSSFITSRAAERMENKKYIPTKLHSLRSLKILCPMGNVCKPQTFEFFTKTVKPGLFFSSAYGTTEYFGFLSGSDFNLPVYKGEVQCCSLGYDLRAINERGDYILGKRGDMVQLNPTPATPVLFLGGDSKKKLKETYLTKYPGTWDIGDDAGINPSTKGFVVCGRSDNVMKPKASRFNCSDIYFALEGFPGFVDSICVSKFNSKQDERIVLFLKMAPGHSLTTEVEDKIRKTIQENLSYEHVPDLIMEVPGVPVSSTLTRSSLGGRSFFPPPGLTTSDDGTGNVVLERNEFSSSSSSFEQAPKKNEGEPEIIEMNAGSGDDSILPSIVAAQSVYEEEGCVSAATPPPLDLTCKESMPDLVIDESRDDERRKELENLGLILDENSNKTEVFKKMAEVNGVQPQELVLEKEKRIETFRARPAGDINLNYVRVLSIPVGKDESYAVIRDQNKLFFMY